MEETVAVPGAVGGANWGNTAANPAAGLVYVMSQDFPSFYKMTTDPGGVGGRRPGGGRGGPGGGRDEGRSPTRAGGPRSSRAASPVTGGDQRASGPQAPERHR